MQLLVLSTKENLTQVPWLVKAPPPLSRQIIFSILFSFLGDPYATTEKYHFICRRQFYNNEPNMAGIYKRIKSRILKKKKGISIFCTMHCKLTKFS